MGAVHSLIVSFLVISFIFQLRRPLPKGCLSQSFRHGVVRYWACYLHIFRSCSSSNDDGNCCQWRTNFKAERKQGKNSSHVSVQCKCIDTQQCERRIGLMRWCARLRIARVFLVLCSWVGHCFHNAPSLPRIINQYCKIISELPSFAFFRYQLSLTQLNIILQ